MDNELKVKYLPPSDLAYGYYLKIAIEEAPKILREKEHKLIDVLSLFEIIQYINDYNKLNNKGQDLLKSIIEMKRNLNSVVGLFFSKVDDKKIIELFNECKNKYDEIEVLLKCFVKYKIFDKISDSTFEIILDNELIYAYSILKHKKIVEKYDNIIKKRLMDNYETAELLVRKYDYDEKETFYLPLLTQNEKKVIISNYIENANANLNYLNALYFHVDSNDSYKLTNKQRIQIKKAISKKNEEISKNGITYGYGIEIIIDENQEDYISPIFEKDKHIYKIPGKWIDKNLDYPTILNNFIYLLNYVDMDMNFNDLAISKNEGIFDRFIFRKNKTNYVSGFVFKHNEAYKHLSFHEYINYLKQKHNIDIEDVIEWFFNEYLFNEFGISNYKINLSIDKKYINRCKSLFPEFDSVLKKYRLFIEFKEISNELLNETKEFYKIDDCPSFIKDKYLVLNEQNCDIINILNLLFSDQSNITYINDNLHDSNFAKLILKNNVKINDFEDREFQLRRVNFLIEKKIIHINNENILEINREILAVCKYLFDHNFLRNHHSEIEQNFIEKGYLLPCTRLFAPDEANYLNYYLNNSKFGDAIALSNKYRHSDTTLEDEKQIYNDYLLGLRMLILIMIKINDELCYYNSNF